MDLEQEDNLTGTGKATLQKYQYLGMYAVVKVNDPQAWIALSYLSSDQGNDGPKLTDAAGNDAFSVASDKVLDQSTTIYRPDSQVFSIVSIQGSKNSTTPGALSATDPNNVVDYRLNYYDHNQRLSATADFGTDAAGYVAATTTYLQSTLSMTNSSGWDVTLFGYNNADLVSTQTDQGGIITASEFDALGRDTKVIDHASGSGAFVAGQSTETTRHFDGLDDILNQTVDSPTGTQTFVNRYGVRKGSSLASAINSNDLIATSDDPSTGLVSYAFDALGEQTKQQDRNGLTQIAYNKDGSVKSTTLPDGKVIASSGTANNGSPTVAKRADGSMQAITHGAPGVVSVGGSGVLSTVTTHDLMTGNLTHLTLHRNGSNLTPVAVNNVHDGVENTAYGYTSDGLLNNITYDDGSQTSYAYSGDSLQGITEAGGTSQTGGMSEQVNYDPKGNKSGFAASVGGDSSAAFSANATSIDSQGRWRVVTDTDGSGATYTRTIAYNPQNQLTSESAAALAAVQTSYDYYSDGNLRDVTLTRGTHILDRQTYTYDSQGRIGTLALASNFNDATQAPARSQTYTYSYKPNTNLLQGITLNGSSINIGFNYDAANDNLTGIGVNTGDDVAAWSAAYHYNLLNQIDTASVATPGTTTSWSYRYDSTDQLKNASASVNGTPQGSLQFNYQYDSAGNRLNATLGDANDLNQYVSDTYDARGNQTADSTRTYTYNALDELTAVTPITLTDVL